MNIFRHNWVTLNINLPRHDNISLSRALFLFWDVSQFAIEPPDDSNIKNHKSKYIEGFRWNEK
jgi:hypothetical protein